MAQRDAFGAQFVTHGTQAHDTMTALGDVVAGKVEVRPPGVVSKPTLFYSLGLAGTEVMFAEDMFRWLDEHGTSKL